MRTFGVWMVAAMLALGTWLIPAPADAQAKVKILAVTSPETRGLKAMAAEFTKKTGIQVEFSEQGRLGYFESVITQPVAGTDAFDRPDQQHLRHGAGRRGGDRVLDDTEQRQGVRPK